MDNLAGALLNQKYLLLRMLGEGGMGAVYEAEELSVGRRVAVKMLSGTLDDPAARQRFELEARALSTLRHPNLVRVTDFSTHHEHPYFVMDLAHGKNLLELVQSNGALPPERVAAIAIQILGALGAAHARGFVHRDIKPQNMQIAPFNAGGDDVKLLDFGLAKNMGSTQAGPALTQEGMVVGTLQYMAPEQALGKKVDARADLYGVGACMYYALTGRRLFEGQVQMGLYRAVLSDEPPQLRAVRPSVPDALAMIVHRAISKDPARRFGSAQAMSEAIGAYLAAARETRATMLSATNPPPASTPGAPISSAAPHSAPPGSITIPHVPAPGSMTAPLTPIPPSRSAPRTPIPTAAMTAPLAPIPQLAPPERSGSSRPSPLPGSLPPGALPLSIPAPSITYVTAPPPASAPAPKKSRWLFWMTFAILASLTAGGVTAALAPARVLAMIPIASR